MIRAIVFDFDGVILESAELKTKAFRKLFEAVRSDKLEEILNYHRKNMGISRYMKFRHIYENILKKPLSFDEERCLGQSFKEIILLQMMEAPFVPGSVEFLQKNQNRLPMFVASGTPIAELHEIARKRNVFQYFVELHGSPEEKKDILYDILGRYQWKPEEVVFVGDAGSDFLASKVTGVHFIARANGGNLPRGECRYCIDDLRELEAVLLKL